MTLPASAPHTGLVVVSRAGCDLCDTMIRELAELEASEAIPRVTIVDVDSDPDLERRFGLKVPVLLLDGHAICHYTLNCNELLRLVRRPSAILPR